MTSDIGGDLGPPFFTIFLVITQLIVLMLCPLSNLLIIEKYGKGRRKVLRRKKLTIFSLILELFSFV